MCEDGVVTILTNSYWEENARGYYANTFDLFEEDSSYCAVIQASGLYELA